MPLDQDIEGGHGEREPGVEIGPDAMRDLFEMTHDGQHGEHRLLQHALLPFPTLTEFEVRGISSAALNAVSLRTNIPPTTLRISQRKVVTGTLAGGTP